ncbi:MAG: hypothetical protein IJU48_05605 [Synergistaceae bacterium]|nr:hypothetical protein [Synergistaceae bacterium]
MPSPNQINSPEQLNEYIRVTSPGAWLILSSILIFLAGFFFWIFTGQLEVSFSSYVFTEAGNSQAFVDVDDGAKLKPGMTVRLADTGTSGTIEKISPELLTPEEVRNIIGENNSWLVNGSKFVKADVKFPSETGARVSRAVFVTETVNPVSFLLK